MKKLTLAMLASVLLFGLAYQTPEIAKAEEPGSDALHEKADAVREALLSGTPEELFNKLAPWLQGRAKLSDARWPMEFEEANSGTKLAVGRESVLERVRKLDPGNTLGVKTFADYVALEAPELVALQSGMLLIQSDESAAEARKAKWFEVDRAVYTAKESHRLINRGKEIERTHGQIIFMDQFEHIIVVEAVSDGDTWHILRATGDLGAREFDTDACDVLADPVEMYVQKGLRDAKRAEAEQLLGSARNHCRVQWSKDASVPKKISDATELEHFEGKYFKLRDTVYKKPDADRAAVVAEPIDDEELGWGVVYFNAGNPESTIKWYNTKEELDEALKAFQATK